MIGVARTNGAISIVNALPTGIGCSVGIGLEVEARVEVHASSGPGPHAPRFVGADPTPLIEASLATGLATFFRDPTTTASLRLRSSVPTARGLKSSSAVSTAILWATARAAGRSPAPLEIGLLAAEVGRKTGVSATGALDDALASLNPGFVVTDNARGTVLRRAEVEPETGVVLYVPQSSHPPSPALKVAFAKEKAAGAVAARAAVEGDWRGAMRLNTEIVERALGYSYEAMRERLRTHGALASGVSGLGPTLATIAPTPRLDELRDALPHDDAQRLVVPFARRSTEEVSAR